MKKIIWVLGVMVTCVLVGCSKNSLGADEARIKKESFSENEYSSTENEDMVNEQNFINETKNEVLDLANSSSSEDIFRKDTENQLLTFDEFDKLSNDEKSQYNELAKHSTKVYSFPIQELGSDFSGTVSEWVDLFYTQPASEYDAFFLTVVTSNTDQPVMCMSLFKEDAYKYWTVQDLLEKSLELYENYTDLGF